MEYFHSIKDSDIFENPLPEPEEYISRPTARAIILDRNNNICVYFTNGRTQFPGGGVEEGETEEKACIRECKEEAGVDVKLLRVLGKAKEYRAKMAKCYDITFFLAKVEGEKDIPTTIDETEKKVVIEWLPKEQVLKRLQEQIIHLPASDPVSMYVPQFNFRTSLAAFKKYLETKN